MYLCVYVHMPACMSPACTTAALCMRACVFRTNNQLDQVMCVLFLEPSGDFWENYLGFSWLLPIGLAQWWSAWAVRNYCFTVHVGFLWLYVDLVLLFSHLLSARVSWKFVAHDMSCTRRALRGFSVCFYCFVWSIPDVVTIVGELSSLKVVIENWCVQLFVRNSGLELGPARVRRGSSSTEQS